MTTQACITVTPGHLEKSCRDEVWSWSRTQKPPRPIFRTNGRLCVRHFNSRNCRSGCFCRTEPFYYTALSLSDNIIHSEVNGNVTQLLYLESFNHILLKWGCWGGCQSVFSACAWALQRLHVLHIYRKMHPPQESVCSQSFFLNVLSPLWFYFSPLFLPLHVSNVFASYCSCS